MDDVFTRNPSEYQRMIEERNEQLRLLQESKNRLATGYLPKSAKESLLYDIRQLEYRLGIESKNYNSKEFST